MIRCFCLACLLWTCLYGCAFGATPDARRFAIAVGHNSGLPAESTLQYTEQDAERFIQTLIDGGGLSADDAVILKGPDVESIRAAFETMKRRLQAHGPNAVFIFYYSGHGDADHLHVGAERFPLKALTRLLDSMPVQLKLAVVDACRGTTDTQTKGFKRAEPFAINLRSPEGMTGVVTLRSSSEGELSQESQQLQGAVFTHYLVTALKGAADFDEDRAVSLHEAYTYAYRQTVNRSAAGPGNIMHPSVEYDVEGVGGFILTRTEPETVHLVLPPGTGSQYLIFAQPSGAVVAEIWSDPDRSIKVATTRGRYLVQRRAGRHSGALELRVREGEIHTLYPDDFQRLPQSVLTRKGGALRLVHHELRAGHSALVMHRGQLGQRTRIRYGFGRVTWTLSAAVERGHSREDSTVDTRDESWWGGDLRIEFRKLLGPLDVHLGMVGRWIRQTYTRVDAERVRQAGYRADFDFSGSGFGPSMGCGYRVALSRQWALTVDVGGTALGTREGAEDYIRLDGGGELALVYEW